jgi:chromatin segregation and condensation protein Rec8/ScpA/Scc1 (kleisin family)
MNIGAAFMALKHWRDEQIAEQESARIEQERLAKHEHDKMIAKLVAEREATTRAFFDRARSLDKRTPEQKWKDHIRGLIRADEYVRQRERMGLR